MSRTIFRLGGLTVALALILVCTPSYGQTLQGKLDAILSPKITTVAIAEDIETSLDGMRLHMRRGNVGWGAPVDGQPTALVFGGEGWVAIPLPDRIERQQVKLFTGSDVLRINFRSAVFRFAVPTPLRRALGDQAHFRAEPEGAALLEAILAGRENADRDASREAPVRILDALSDGSEAPPWAQELLLAQFQRLDGVWVHVDVDPFAPKPLRVYTIVRRNVPTSLWLPAIQGMRFQNTWTELPPPAGASPPPPWSISSYAFTIALGDSTSFVATETLSLQSASGHRGILLRLDGKYRVLSASVQGHPIPLLQARDPSRMFEQDYAGNWVYLQWPVMPPMGRQVDVTFEIGRKGAFISGNQGNLHAWTWPGQTWYPMIPFGGATPRATFTVKLDRTGRVRNREVLMAHWGADPANPLPMTGFGLQVSGPLYPGKFRPEVVPGLDVAPLPGGRWLPLLGVPRIYNLGDYYVSLTRRAITDALSFYSAAFGILPITPLGFDDGQPFTAWSRVTGRRDGYRTSSPGEMNNLPSSRPVPTPVAGLYGRDAPSWPGLIMVDPGWAALALGGYAPRTRIPYGELRPSRRQLLEITPAHVVAHQWWDDWVGWAGHQDSWLGEALANGSANIFEAHEFGAESAAAIRAAWLEELTATDTFGQIPNELGPLCLGPRLASSVDPAGYDVIAQDKGGYVVEMLRAMMGETRFRAAMHALTATYGNRNISAAEFERLMAAHMSPAMDLEHNGSLQWFFDEYVRRRAIPALSVSWRQSGNNVEITIANPAHWRGLLPFYLYQGAIHTQRALIPVSGANVRATIQATFTPTRIASDPFHEMLVTIVDSRQRTVPKTDPP